MSAARMAEDSTASDLDRGLMGKTFAEVKDIANQFAKFVKYDPSRKNQHGINMIGISTIEAQRNDDGFLMPGENEKDYCLSIGFSKKYANGLPLLFEGVRVYYRVIGTVVPL